MQAHPRRGDLGRRLTRLRPAHLPGRYLVWAIACWAMTVMVAAVILIPGLSDAITADGVGVVAEFSAPLAFRVAMLIAVAVLAGASVVWVLLRDRMQSPHRTHDTWVRESVLFGVALFPIIALLADGSVPRALLAALPSATLLVVSHVAPLRAAAGAPAALGCLAALPWLSLVPYQLTPEASSSSSWL